MALPVLRRHREPDRESRRHHIRSREISRQPTRPWSPWAEFAEMHDRMGRLLTEAFGPGFGEIFRDRFGELAPADGWHPASDVEETDDAYLVEIELPGVRREDVTVEFGHGELLVTGEVKERERVGLFRHRTRRVGRFDYRIDLPGEVLDDQISASLADGVLTVRVPKSERARRRRIAINSGSAGG